MNSLIERLIARHRLINREIRRELTRPLPDQFRLGQLKKQRLRAKDGLFRHLPQATEFRRTARFVLARLRRQGLLLKGI